MAKKIQDIKAEAEVENINLTERLRSSESLIKKKLNVLYKQKTPIKKVQDLSGTETDHFIYIKGKKFTPPKFLGNLLKIGIAGFLIILLFNTINVYYTGKKLEKNIAAEAYEGYSFLIDAGKNASKIQFDKASESFAKAMENFSTAKNELWFISTDKSFYSQQNNIGQAVNALLVGGQHFSTAGNHFLDALEEFNQIPLYFVAKNNNPKDPNPSITDSLKNGLDKTNLAIEEINLAAVQLANVNENGLSSEIAARIKVIKKQVAELSATLNATSAHFPALLKLLGDRYPHRYLILLQNNNEIRPSGGFIGSYAIMDINEGYIEKLEVHDVYDIDGSYKGIIEPPDELKKFTGNWRFRDSNYSPDFPTSAAKAKWFLQKEGGPGVDTIIAINQGLLADLLEITGPIQVGNFGKLNSENYNLLLSYVIEGKIWGAEDPKHILKVFIPEFKKAILQEKNIARVSSKLYRAIQQKHVMMYSGDDEVENLFDAMGISGKVYQNTAEEDYLSVINTSIGGTKSDQFVEENILHDTFIDKNGNVTDEVTIKRSHLWDDEIYYKWKKILKAYSLTEMPDGLIDILGRGRNKVFMRIYVPDGSILLNSTDATLETKYDKDLKKTYFLATVEINAGETNSLKIRYRLPFILDLQNAGNYKLITEKQPGSRGSIFTKTVHTDPEVYSLSVYPKESRIDAGGNVIYATNLVYDRYFSGIWSK